MKFSFIIPSYNVGLYIAECLDSILNQTYKDFEIICVDDASTDDTYNILLMYAKENRQIKLIRNECNKGVSYCRNRGLEEAGGEYIFFVDPDDMLKPEALETVNNALEDDIEVVSFRFLVRNEGTVAKEQNFLPDEQLIFYGGVQSGQKWFMERVRQKQLLISPWAQVYKREFLLRNKLTFCEGVIFEDWLYTFDWSLAASKVVNIHKYIYIYRKRDNSITSTINKLSLDSYIIMLGKVLTKWRTCKLEDGMDEAIQRYIGRCALPAINRMRALFPEYVRLETGTQADQFLFDLYSGVKQKQKYFVHLGDDQIEYIKQYKNIIVFGAGIVAIELIDSLKEYCIRTTAVAVSDKSINMKQIDGIDIYQIEELTDMQEDALVIVAVLVRSQEPIKDKLKKLGFRNAMYIDTDKVFDM